MDLIARCFENISSSIDVIEINCIHLSHKTLPTLAFQYLILGVVIRDSNSSNDPASEALILMVTSLADKTAVLQVILETNFETMQGFYSIPPENMSSSLNIPDRLA